MKDVKIILIMLLLLSSIVSVSAAVDTPRIEPYVNDFVGLLDADQILALNLLSDSIEANTSYEIAVVIVPTTGGDDPVIFANKIGDLNGVGKKDLDNGIVVLWSIENEYGGAIATGRGSESILNDAKVGIIGRAARPLFDDGKYYEGLTQIVTEINLILEEDKVISTIPVDTSSDDDPMEFWFMVILGTLMCVFFFMAISSIMNEDDSGSDYGESKKYTKRKGKDGKYRYYAGTGRSYSSAGAACAALALLGSGDSDSDDDDSSSGGSSFSGTSFGSGSFGGGGCGF